MKKLILLIFIYSNIFAQPNYITKNIGANFTPELSIKPFKLNTFQNIQKNSVYAQDFNYSEFFLDDKELSKINGSTSRFNIKVSLIGNKEISINLFKVNPFAENYISSNGDGKPLAIPNNGYFFHGIVADDPQSNVAVSIFPNSIDILIDSPNGRYSIRKISDKYLYTFDDVIDSEKNQCSVADTSINEKINSGINGTQNCKVVNITVSTAYNIYQIYGINTWSKIITVVNQINIPYHLVGVGLKLVETRIQDTPGILDFSDYTTLLDSYNNYYYSYNGAPSHLGILFSNSNYSGVVGLAHIANICNNTQLNHTGWARVNGSSTDYLVVAHEIGHILGQVHVSTQTIMNPILSSFRNTFDSESAFTFTYRLNECGIINNERPTNLYSTNVASNSAIVNWNKTSSGTNYIVSYRRAIDPSFTVFTVGDVNAVTLYNLIPNTLYEWTVMSDCSDESTYPYGYFSTFLENNVTINLSNNFTICPNNLFDIPFTAVGTYNTGNIFTAQLSDVNGSFISPTTLGTLTTTTSGAISATIPNSISVGTGYQIRIISSNPSMTTNPSVPITIVAVCPPPCPTSLTLASTNVPSDDISSGILIKEVNATMGVIIASNKITNTANVTYRAGKSITLEPGFKAENGTVFKAEQGGCN